MQVKKQQLELDMEKWTGSKLGKEYIKAVNCHPAYSLFAEYIVQNAGLDEAQAGIKIARRNINNLRYPDDNILLAESKAKLKRLLMKVKEESEVQIRSVAQLCPTLCDPMDCSMPVFPVHYQLLELTQAHVH